MPTQNDFNKARIMLDRGPFIHRSQCTVADSAWILARRPELILDKTKAYMITLDGEITEL